MAKTVLVKGKMIRVPVIVARKGPFFLVRKLTDVPKPLGIEFVVKRETRFGPVLVSSNITAKTKAKGKQLLNAAFQSEELLKKGVESAKQAGAIGVKGVISAARIGFRLAEKGSRPGKRKRKAKRKSKKKKRKQR